MIREKVFFKGTPAQFCAVMEEYELDAREAGRQFSIDIIEPKEEVVVSGFSQMRIAEIENPPLFSSPDRTHVLALRSDSPRAVIECSSRISFLISALACPNNRTLIAVRLPSNMAWEFIQSDWDSIISYMAGLDYLEESETIEQVKLLEPEEWIKTVLKDDIGSLKWWEKVEKLTREYWLQHGRRALPIKGRLDSCLGYRPKTIYQKTGLGDKTGNTR